MKSSGWFAVRCVFQSAEIGAWPSKANSFEERITLVQARSFEEAHHLGEREAVDYAEGAGSEFLGVAQCTTANLPASGALVFSLVRDSQLDAGPYLSRFFDTGHERLQDTDPGVEVLGRSLVDDGEGSWTAVGVTTSVNQGASHPMLEACTVCGTTDWTVVIERTVHKGRRVALAKQIGLCEDCLALLQEQRVVDAASRMLDRPSRWNARQEDAVELIIDLTRDVAAQVPGQTRYDSGTDGRIPL